MMYKFKPYREASADHARKRKEIMTLSQVFVLLCLAVNISNQICF